jgi:hypothetical protein
VLTGAVLGAPRWRKDHLFRAARPRGAGAVSQRSRARWISSTLGAVAGDAGRRSGVTMGR